MNTIKDVDLHFVSVLTLINDMYLKLRPLRDNHDVTDAVQALNEAYGKVAIARQALWRAQERRDTAAIACADNGDIVK